jgi:hypothetical protein
MEKDEEDLSMNGKTQWLLGSAIGLGLLVGSVVATQVSAQTAPTPGTSGTSFCPGQAASIAQEQNVDLSKVVEAALAAHSAQLDAAVKAGTLTQAQADAMKAFMKARIESRFQDATGVAPHGFGMMGGRGMMGPGFGPPWRSAP